PEAKGDAPPSATVEAPKVEHVKIRISTSLSGVTLSLDNTPVANPFEADTAKSDWRHLVEVSRNGRVIAERWVTFDDAKEIAINDEPPAPKAIASKPKKSPRKSTPAAQPEKLITDYPN